MKVVLPYQFAGLLFLFLVWLLQLGLFSTVLNKICEWTFLSRSWSQGKSFQFFATEDDVSSGFFIDGLYYVEVCSPWTYFVEGFYHEWLLCFDKRFCIYWKDYMVFIHSLTDVMYHVAWFVNTETPLCPRNRFQQIVANELLMYGWIWFANIPLRLLCSMFIRDFGL